MLDWTGERVRRLRGQLGWSRAELARRLSLSWEAVQSLEEDHWPQSEELIIQLDRMQSYVESCRLRQANEPIAELLLRERRITQIEAQEVISHRELNFEVDN